MKRVSEVVTLDEVKKWRNSDIITIIAGCGDGKSHFIKNILYALAKYREKKILMLIHRTNCVNQFQKEIERDKKMDTITIMTYQKIESIIFNHKKTFNFFEYEYIVCDEFHYFLSDAAFNKTTDISLNLILSQANTTRIFMSATGDYMRRYINNIKGLPTIDYELPINYDFIKQLTFFNKDATLEEFIKEAITENTKGIFFIQSAKKAYALYEKFKDHCLFNCSKGNSEFYKYVNKEKINDMLIHEKFEELFLITTTCMDSGVNIKDKEVQHLVIDVDDIGVLLQCLGRRRIKNTNDKFNLYIKEINNQQLGGKETQLKEKIKKADYLRKHNVKEYIQKYPRSNDYNNIVYDDIVDDCDKGTKKINELMFFKCKLDIGDIATMKEYGKYGFCKYLKELFGYKKKYRLIEEEYRQAELEQYLESIDGKKLNKSEQKELIDKVGLKDKRGRIQKSIGVLNAYFKANNMKFIIESKRKSVQHNAEVKESYWMVNSVSKMIDENMDKAI